MAAQLTNDHCCTSGRDRSGPGREPSIPLIGNHGILSMTSCHWSFGSARDPEFPCRFTSGLSRLQPRIRDFASGVSGSADSCSRARDRIGAASRGAAVQVASIRPRLASQASFPAPTSNLPATKRSLLDAPCGRDERVGLYSCPCDAVIDDLAADRGLSSAAVAAP